MKKLNGPFKDAMYEEYKSNKKIRERVDEDVYNSATQFFKALQAEKKGADVRDILANLKPEDTAGKKIAQGPEKEYE